ncbi:hypothetical protein [Halopiger xanaduensis]|uniref:Envelope protein N-terminal domain-containing protein n=1 Tax=Halopiger xanaduensis (strain DSM 18323 / JCM 14033 / SH-6) TaxID=797210 RepID=F8D5M4_HALXS|nr:hypothetical protein [Halopiger xanaduensis]AEH38865.1 hypothetical protein Halxa_4263 [Halopiger xanaduensis SH-6]
MEHQSSESTANELLESDASRRTVLVGLGAAGTSIAGTAPVAAAAEDGNTTNSSDDNEDEEDDDTIDAVDVATAGAIAGSPAGAAGYAAYQAATWVAGYFGTSEQSEYQQLNRLGHWAEVYQTALRNRAASLTTTTLGQDVGEMSRLQWTIEATQEALIAAEDGASRQEAINQGVEYVEEGLAGVEQNLIDEGHVHILDFVNALKDAEILEELEPHELLKYTDDLSADDPSYDYVLEEGSVEEAGTVEYELLNGETITHTLYQFTEDYYPQNDGSGPGAGDNLVLNVSGLGGAEIVSDVSPAAENWETAGFRVPDWPQDEYDQLSEERQEDIEPPSINERWDDPVLLHLGLWAEAIEEIRTVVDDVTAEIEAFLDEAYEDIVNGDRDAADFFTPSMFAASSPENSTYAFSGAALSTMGMSLPEETVTVETELPVGEDGAYESVELSGTLTARPHPSGGFSVGQTIDPADLESRFYMSYHVENEGEVQSDIVELRQPFTITDAKEVDPETGEVNDVEELTYTETETSESPADYDALIQSMEELSQFERDLETEQQEVVVELEDERNGLSLPGNPFDFESGNSMLGLAIIAGVLLVLVSLVTDLVPFLGD